MIIETKQAENKPLTVTVEYPEYTPSVKRLIQRLRSMDISFTGRIDERTVSIGLSDVYYIENVERKLFIYTKDEVYRYDGTMADADTMSEDTELVRISRTCIMNTAHLTEIRQIKNSHLEAVLDNGEMLIVSRKYLKDIKRIFRREKP